jgi:hypothetical protein
VFSVRPSPGKEYTGLVAGTVSPAVTGWRKARIHGNVWLLRGLQVTCLWSDRRVGKAA